MSSIRLLQGILGYTAEPYDLSMPERKLLLAVVNRALLDITRPGAEYAENSNFHDGGNSFKNYQLAWDFLLSDSNIPFSFRWICDHLGQDGNAMAERVRLDILKKRKNRQLLKNKTHRVVYVKSKRC